MLGVFISCDSARVLTSVNYQPKPVEAQKIIDYCNKNGLDGTPILTFGRNNLNQQIQLPYYPFYDKSGRFISFDDTASVCRAREYYYIQIRELLNNRIKPLYPDSTYVKVTRSYRVKSSLSGPNTDNNSNKDSLVTETKLISYPTYLDYFSKYLVGINGDKQDINTMYNDYLLMYEFSIFGKRKLTTVSIKDLKKDVDKLNSEFGNKIKLVLINADYLTWFDK